MSQRKLGTTDHTAEPAATLLQVPLSEVLVRKVRLVDNCLRRKLATCDS